MKWKLVVESEGFMEKTWEGRHVRQMVTETQQEAQSDANIHI